MYLFHFATQFATGVLFLDRISLPGSVLKCQLGHGSQAYTPDDQVGLHPLIGRLPSRPVLAQQPASQSQAGFEGTQAPVIVLLPGQQLLGQAEQSHKLPTSHQSNRADHTAAHGQTS